MLNESLVSLNKKSKRLILLVSEVGIIMLAYLCGYVVSVCIICRNRRYIYKTTNYNAYIL